MPLSEQLTRYSLVKGERIVRYASSSRLDTSHLQILTALYPAKPTQDLSYVWEYPRAVLASPDVAERDWWFQMLKRQHCPHPQTKRPARIGGWPTPRNWVFVYWWSWYGRGWAGRLKSGVGQGLGIAPNALHWTKLHCAISTTGIVWSEVPNGK